MAILPEPIRSYLQKIRDAIYGEEVRGSIIGAITQCYQDAGNLSEINLGAAERAERAAEQADTARDEAKKAASIADTATTNANAAAQNAADTRQDILDRMAAGEFKGDKGDKGDKGEQGESGVTAPSSGMFTLKLDPETGNLYAVYPDGETPPKFRYDEATGNLYYVIEEEN